MSTTLIPVDPASTPLQSTRILTISASLLPEEILKARQAKRSRGWVIVAVAVVACLCAAWVAYANHQKSQAEQDLTAATTLVTDLQRSQRGFSETVQVQSDTALLTEQLTAVMANDLDWAAMLNTLRSAGIPSGVTIDGVSGSLHQDGADSAAKVLPGATTTTSVGTLVVSGAAPDKRAVAAYVDALGKQTVLANPYVTSVASEDTGTGVTFSLKAEITNAALCGRFTTACKSSGGK
jgi:Tfp pilus assembly protein PilN